ncbi:MULTISPECIES: hypothetical protein [Halorussus]|uniref:Uncharacterized protein n=1 Tax=Halorussus aquaticus TaxID=2953748 RepID=A0ABD5PZS6_9EURY|nr:MULTISPECIES: hypothetical protein [Halorussus]
MSETETSERITAHFHDGNLELRSKESPDAWIIAEEPVSVER